jgi:undecaprenyl-diphosphatase
VAFSQRTRRRLLAWGSASTVTCLALCVLAAHRPLVLAQWDHVLMLGPDRWRPSTPWLERPLVWVSSAFGTVASAIATAVVAGLLLIKGQRRAAAYVVLAIAGTSLVTSGLKQYVGLARPVVVDPILQYTSSAMPSGHASNIAAAVTVACILSTLFPRLRARRRVVLAVGVLVALVVGLDRLMLGVHTLTEVVAGYALGLGVGLLAAYVVDPAARVGATVAAGVEAPG